MFDGQQEWHPATPTTAKSLILTTAAIMKSKLAKQKQKVPVVAVVVQLFQWLSNAHVIHKI